MVYHRGDSWTVFRVGGLVNNDLKTVILPQGRDVAVDASLQKAERFAWNYHHFVEHVEAAAAWMNLPILWIEDSVWHEALGKNSRGTAADLILEAAEKWKWDPTTEEELAIEKKLAALYVKGIARPDRLYNKNAVAELRRHIEEGRY